MPPHSNRCFVCEFGERRAYRFLSGMEFWEPTLCMTRSSGGPKYYTLYLAVNSLETEGHTYWRPYGTFPSVYSLLLDSSSQLDAAAERARERSTTDLIDYKDVYPPPAPFAFVGSDRSARKKSTFKVLFGRTTDHHCPRRRACQLLFRSSRTSSFLPPTTGTASSSSSSSACEIILFCFAVIAIRWPKIHHLWGF